MAKIKRIPDTDTFHFLNVNPKGVRAGDCVVRAMSVFLDWSWETTYQELANLGMKTGYIINDDENYQSLLSELGFKKQRQPRKIVGLKYTAAEFCMDIAETGKMYLLRVANHLTVVGPDKRIWDTWDCGYKTVGNYWVR